MMRKRCFAAFVNLIFLFVCSDSMYAQEPLYPTLNANTLAPDIKGKNEKGRNCSLEKTKSRLTLLYFYEVHCHLCESMVPKLKELYEAYQKTGLEIIAVPISSTKQDWKQYLSENQFPWKHIYPNEIDLLKSNYVLTVYPTFYLIDKKHILLTQRMGRIEQVEEALNLNIR